MADLPGATAGELESAVIVLTGRMLIHSCVLAIQLALDDLEVLRD